MIPSLRRALKKNTIRNKCTKKYVGLLGGSEAAFCRFIHNSIKRQILEDPVVKVHTRNEQDKPGRKDMQEDLIPSPLVVDDAILFSSTANFDGRYCFLLPQTTSSFCVATNFTFCSTCLTLDHDHFGSSHGRHPHLPLALRMATLLVQYGIFACVVRGPSSRTTQKQQHSHAMLTKFQ